MVSHWSNLGHVPISASQCAHGGPFIDHSPFLKPEVVSTPPKPWGPRAMEVWFCPKEKWSANIRRRNNRCWKAEQPHRPPQTPTMCRALQAEGIWWWTRQTFSQTLRSSHLGEIFKKSKLTYVLKITNCDHFYERQTKYSESILSKIVRKEVTLKLRHKGREGGSHR